MLCLFGQVTLGLVAAGLVLVGVVACVVGVNEMLHGHEVEDP